MEEEMQFIVDNAKESMQLAIKHLEKEMLNIRAGKANPIMLSGVKVDYYGTPTPLSQVANINSPDGKTLTVQPWDKSNLDAIATGIINANLGLNPQSNGESIIINVPVLTEERRKDLVKKAKSEGENAKVSIRNNRKDANDGLKKLKNDGLAEDRVRVLEDEVQQLTDSSISRIDSLIEAKEKDIMTI